MSIVSITKVMGVGPTLKSFSMYAFLSTSFLLVAYLSDLEVIKNQEKVLSYWFVFNFARIIVG